MATAVPASVTQTPSSASKNTLIRRVLNFVMGADDDDSLNAVALDALNSAVALINSRKWYKLFSNTDLTMAADTSTYGLPADFKEPMSAFELNSSDERNQRIPYLPLKSMLDERPIATTSGNPQTYGINYGTRQFTFDIPPSSSFVSRVPQVRIYYYKRIPELTDTSQTIGADPEFDWYVVWSARREIAAIRDPQKYSLADREAERFLRELRRSDTDQMTDHSVFGGYS